MRVDDILARGFTRSFEFFPTRTDEEGEVLRATLEELRALEPSFVSVTYRGGVESRQRTYDLVTSIEAGGTTAMAHLICVDHTRSQMRDLLARYRAAGVVNLMALGGDTPDGRAPRGELRHAHQVVELAREVGPFCVGVGAHPRGHPRSPDRESDRRFLAEKLRHADFAVTQFFFDVEEWTALVGDLVARGIDRPVIAGIMPVTSLSSIPRMAVMGASVPAWLAERLVEADRRGGPAQVRREGIAAAIELCQALVEVGVPGLHFYTLNRSTATRDVHRALFA